MKINKSNQHIIDNLSHALLCATELNKRGILINSIDIHGKKPQIDVVHCKRLTQMNGVHVAVINTNQQRVERLSVDFKGADVQWHQPIN